MAESRLANRPAALGAVPPADDAGVEVTGGTAALTPEMRTTGQRAAGGQ
jgi:hypothetical protein